MAETTRDELAEQLLERLPADWVIVPFSRNLDTVSKTTVMLHATEIRPGTTQGLLEVDYVITVISPKSDATNAQDDLDDQVLNVILPLRDSAPGLVFRNAVPSTTTGDNFAWDINTTIHARKDA